MGFFDRLFGRKPQTTPTPVNEPKEEVQETAPTAQPESAPVAVETAAPVAVPAEEKALTEEA